MKLLEVTDLTLEVPGRELLSDLYLEADAGECVAIMGPSGSGKTSLLHCICGIVSPTSGVIQIGKVALSALDVAERARFRLKHIGIIFQFGELLPELTAVENVALPLRLMGIPRPKAEQRALNWLEALGLSHRRSAHPDKLSGGEVQRVGIARALVHEPHLILADEPTGALDQETTVEIISLLRGLSKKLGVTVIMATHNPLVAQAADRILYLQEKRLESHERIQPLC